MVLLRMTEKMRKSSGKGKRGPGEAHDGRDELNLAEFPVAALSMRLPRGQNTLVFQDHVWDRGKRQRVTRKLTVSASDKYGLPTALDDEVLVGLVQLTTRGHPLGRTVQFTRYQLLDLLGWRKEGKSYRRLEQSLKRWLGVTLYYDKAWWDKAERSWVSENFHVLESVTLYERDQRHSRGCKVTAPPGLSSFAWSEAVFRSFQAGYLKRLDLEVYRSLRLAIAKRLYRFLDKRFYHRDRWAFDLREFACEHIGISRNSDIGQLKRRLRPALSELESVGVLKPREDDRRYVRVARGKWDIIVERAGEKKALEREAAEVGDTCQALIDHGVSHSMANALARQYPAGKIQEKVEMLDTLMQADHNAIASPGGFLVEAIRKDYVSLRKPRANVARVKTRSRSLGDGAKAGGSKRRPQSSDSAKWAKEEARIREYLGSLGSEAREQVSSEALAHAPRLLRTLYSDRLREGSPQAEWYREQIIRHHVRRRLIQDQ